MRMKVKKMTPEEYDDNKAAEWAADAYRKGELEITPIENYDYDTAWKQIRDHLEVNEVNTIPEKATLTVTFEGVWPSPGQYTYRSKGEDGIRKTMKIDAIIHYTGDASGLVTGRMYPLALSKGAMNGLFGYITSQKKSLNLKGKTFTVYNKNRKTYVWEEDTSQTGR